MKLPATWKAGCWVLMVVAQAAAQPLFENNIEKLPPGPVPEEFMVLEGQFTVSKEDGNQFIELPGAPLETFGLLFGPNQKENVAARARIYGTSKGRRFPVFGLSLNGVSGFRLIVSPGKKQAELVRGDSVKQSVPFEWQSGKWVQLRLCVESLGAEGWRIQGWVWPDGAAQPQAPLLVVTDKDAPVAGRAAIWGSPFSDTSIRFDDLMLEKCAASTP